MKLRLLIWLGLLLGGGVQGASSWPPPFPGEEGAGEWVSVRNTVSSPPTVDPPPDWKGEPFSGVRLTSPGQSGFFTRSLPVPLNLSDRASVVFWVHRDAEEAARLPVTVLELQFYEPDSPVRFWRKVEIEHSGWKKIELPLRWFRHSGGRLPRWDNIQRMGFWFREPGTLTLGGLQLLPGAGDSPARVSPPELAALAFPDIAPAERRIVSGKGFSVMAGHPDIDLKALVERLNEVAGALRSELGLENPSPHGEAVLILFPDRNSYQAFATTLARAYGAEAGPPQSDGYSMDGIAFSVWDPAQGAARPVFTHEFIHALVFRELGLSTVGDWFQEGLANHYQLRFHPQPNFGNIVREGLARRDFRLPLLTLFSGETIPMRRYWQTAVWMDFLLHHPDNQAVLPKLMPAMLARGSADVTQLLPELTGRSLPELEQVWIDFAAKQYSPPAPAVTE